MEKVKNIPKSEKAIFDFRKDVYNSRYVSAEAVSEHLDDFEKVLYSTIALFKEEKTKGFFLDLSLSNHIECFKIVSKLGFKFHHAEGDQATFVKFLPENRVNRLPHYSTHYVGIGGMVISKEKKQILVIKEKSGNDTQGWKIPGGLVDVGEYLDEAVVREVFEETGIKSNFKGVLGFREKKPYNFGRNDLYFFCLLEPENEEINQCQDEIAKSRWIPIQEFVDADTRVDTQKRISKLAKKVLEYIEEGKSLDDMCWPREEAKTNLETYKSIHPIYHSKL